jgi:hypothetical protein
MSLEKSNLLLFVLDANKNPIRADGLLAWSEFMKEPHRVAVDVVNGIRVSTAFIGVGGNYKGRPCPFETLLIRDGEPLNHRQRYATWEQAAKGHTEWLKAIRAGQVHVTQ